MIELRAPGFHQRATHARAQRREKKWLRAQSVASLALTLALVADETVFGMVLGAWSALGASLGPVLLVRLARLPLGQVCALTMMASGFAVQLFWQRSGLAKDVFELLPGMLAPFLVYAAFSPAHAAQRLSG